MGVTDYSLISRLPENKVYILAKGWDGGTELCLISFCPSASRCACPLSHLNLTLPVHPACKVLKQTHTHTLSLSLSLSHHTHTHTHTHSLSLSLSHTRTDRHTDRQTDRQTRTHARTHTHTHTHTLSLSHTQCWFHYITQDISQHLLS